MERVDFLIIGAGIAGASAGYELSARGKVILLERESQAGYHTTGRSAAMFLETYGNPTIRAITSGSRQFFLDPPDGFAEHPLLTPRGALSVGRPDQLDELDRSARELGASARRLDAAETLGLVPVLRPEVVAGGILEPDAMDIDAHGLHQGFLRGMGARGGKLVVNGEVRSLARADDAWLAETPAGSFAAPVVVNAAGAWCDQIAELAGARLVGLVPKRRTVITFDPPAGQVIDDWPLVVGIAEDFYFKPDAGRFLGSPGDETPMAPCDVQPDELDVAIVVDRIQTMTALEIKRIHNKWAGLRSFVPDKSPVVGFDPACEGFFWLAGQGGYGMQTSPAMGRLAAALATGGPLPTDLVDLGLSTTALTPARFA
jgi:D-arginine dehydrogenase